MEIIHAIDLSDKNKNKLQALLYFCDFLTKPSKTKNYNFKKVIHHCSGLLLFT